MSKNGWKEHINLIAYKLIPNEPRFNIHNRWEHECAKSKLLFNLKQKGIIAYAEVIFTNGQRCDILVPSTSTIYEILFSETISKFKEKIKKYPSYFEIIPLKAEDVLKDGFVL